MSYKNKKDAPRYHDSILTQNLGMVRLSEIKDDTRLKIAGRWFVAADIPLNAVVLSCNHSIRGIALAENNVVFCEICKENAFVGPVI